jgi:hypothetical protein
MKIQKPFRPDRSHAAYDQTTALPAHCGAWVLSLCGDAAAFRCQGPNDIMGSDGPDVRRT